MTITFELPFDCDVIVGLCSTNPDDMADFQRIVDRRKQQGQGIPIALVKDIAKTKTAKIFIKPLVQAMTPGTRYSSASMGQLLGGWSAKKVASKLCVLGRPEKRHKAQIFQRIEGKYVISPQMKAALIDAI